MHGWHLKYGCQSVDCSCSLGAGGALLASDWLAERERAAAAKALAAVEALANQWEREDDTTQPDGPGRTDETSVEGCTTAPARSARWR